MALAQDIRHSKTSTEVVNEKRGGSVFKWNYRMLGSDCNKTPDRANPLLGRKDVKYFP
jgi:hypothetical protein